MTELSSRYTSGEYRTRHPEWHGERAGWKAAQVARSCADALDQLVATGAPVRPSASRQDVCPGQQGGP